MTDLRKQAQQVAAAGRGPDTMLMHVTPDEIRDISKMGIAAGLGPVGINPATGYPEAGFFGDLFKGIAKALPGVLGTAFLGPLGGALAQGLFTGATEDNWKKGLLAGLGTYMGGKALSGAVDASRGAEAARASVSAANPGSVVGDAALAQSGVPLLSEPATQAASQGFLDRGVSFLKDMPGALTDRSALETGLGTLTEGRAPLFVYPAMKEIDASIQQDERARRGSGFVPYEDRIAAEMDRFRRIHGNSPYNFYGSRIRRYMAGGKVGPGMDYNRFATGGMVPYTGNMPVSMAASSYDERQNEEGGYGPRSYPTGNETEYDPEGNPIYPDQGGVGGNPDDTGGGNMYSNMFKGIQSWAPPQGFMPGFHGEFQYMSQNRPPNPMGFGNQFGQSPFGYNPFQPPGMMLGQQMRSPLTGMSLRDMMVQKTGEPAGLLAEGATGPNPTPPRSDPGAGGGDQPRFSPNPQGFNNPFGQPNPYMGQFGAPPFQMGGYPSPFQSPFQSFGGFGYSPSPMMGGIGAFGGFGGGGFGGGFGMRNPYARYSGPMMFAQGGPVNPDGGMGDGIAAAIVAPDGSSEPAMLSPGEYVIPADVVSMLGDGDTDSGSDMLDQMLTSVRMQKTGQPNQLPPTNPNLLPG